VRKNCSSDQEKLLKFKDEGQEFSKVLRSLKVRLSENEFLKSLISEKMTRKIDDFINPF
jgi:hypothetical protein